MAFQVDAFQSGAFQAPGEGGGEEEPEVSVQAPPESMGHYNNPFFDAVEISLEKLGLRSLDEEDDEFLLLM